MSAARAQASAELVFAPARTASKEAAVAAP
jgi:hypothetical protein